MDHLVPLREGIGTSRESPMVEATYPNKPDYNFSKHFLERISYRMGVLELEGVQWNDGERSERIVETLRLPGEKLALPIDPLNNHPDSAYFR